MTIHINLDEVREVAATGMRRASVFIGFGVNLADDPQQHPFHLPGQLHLRIVSPDADEDRYKHYTEAFRQWIIANGFKELIETFELYLDHVYATMMRIESWEYSQASGLGCDGIEQRNKFKTFQWCGVTDKLARLEKEFGIFTEFNEELDSIKRARNCLTHRLGIVGQEDLKKDKNKQIIETELIVKWHVMEWYGYNEDGSEFIPQIDSLPVQFPTGSPMKIRFPERQKSFAIGTPISFEPCELNEICFSFLLKTSQMEKALIQAIQARGIEVNTTEKSLEEILSPEDREKLLKQFQEIPPENSKLIRIDF